MTKLRLGLVALAMIGGLAMPTFYDWTGADQSRPAPVVAWIALGIVALDVLAIGWLVFSPHAPKLEGGENEALIQFSLRQVWIVTTIAAVACAAVALWQLPLGRVAAFGLVVYAVWLAVRRPEFRWSIAVLLICMWAPFLWVFSWQEPGRSPWLILAMLDLPALILAGWISMFFRWNLLLDSGIGCWFMVTELGIGLWMIHSGPKRAMAYTIGAITLALFSSFALHALVRA